MLVGPALVSDCGVTELSVVPEAELEPLSVEDGLVVLSELPTPKSGTVGVVVVVVFVVVVDSEPLIIVSVGVMLDGHESGCTGAMETLTQSGQSFHVCRRIAPNPVNR